MAKKNVKYVISLEDKFAGAMNRVEKRTDRFDKKITSLGSKLTSVFGAAIGIRAVTEFGNAVVATTAEFEKFEAVLENTLGDKSEAKKAMTGIVDFASRTPFQVNELTGSFVKLVNQGFKPTQKEMTNLGDLAASTGKGFDQLTEAIIDAQVGEFERLKEFGIRASKQGDKVTFTFKGVKKQVDFTEKSIQSYILSLGKAQGVSGAMAKISATTGGQISNLKDSIDQTKLALGRRFNPQIKKTIGLTAKMVKGLERFVRIPTAKTIEDQKDKLNGLIISLKDSTKSEEDRLKIIEEIKEISPDVAKSIKKEGEAYTISTEALKKFNDEQINRIILAKQQEKLIPLVERRNELSVKRRENEIELSEKLAKSFEEIRKTQGLTEGQRKSLLSIADEDLTVSQKAAKLTMAIIDIEKRLSQTKLKQLRTGAPLTKERLKEKDLAEEIKTIDLELNNLKAERLKLERQLGIRRDATTQNPFSIEPSAELTDSMTTLKAAAPKTFNINIEKLVEEFNINNVETVQEGAVEAKNIVVRELSRALADLTAIAE